MNTPQHTQEELAAIIDEDGLPFQYRRRNPSFWEGADGLDPPAAWYVADGQEIRLTPPAAQ